MIDDVPGDLTFRTLTAADADGEHGALVRGFGTATTRGFHDGRMSEEQVAVWLEGATGDRQVFRGGWPATAVVGAPDVPVATFTSWSGGPLSVGGAQLALHMITDVTVSPTHRRRGLLRRMMHEDLTEAAGRGLALAALTSTEGSIYGRFGFGPATRLRAIEVDVTSRFALRSFEDVGRLEVVEPADAWPTLRDLQRRWAAQMHGAIVWPAFYEPFMSGRFSWDAGGPDKKMQLVLHLDAAGEPDGFATWRHKGEQDGRATLEVGDTLSLSPGTHLALWRFLAGIDLTERVRWSRAPLVDPLEWALDDPRAVRTTGVRDMLWLRVLDVTAALEARRWYGEGSVVLGVSDAVGIIDGSWRVVAAGGQATVEAVDADPDVRLDADALGSLYLGGVDVATLAAAGRLVGSSEAIARLGALMDGGPTPYCTTGF